MAHSRETKEKFIALRADGISYDRIRERLGVSKQTLIKWGKQLANQIAGLREARVDELCEKYLLAKERRIALFAEQLLRLRDELGDRSLDDLTVKEVLSLYLRYLRAVSREIEPLQVDVSLSSEMERYREIVVKCMEIPAGMTEGDIPALADALVKDQSKRDQKLTET